MWIKLLIGLSLGLNSQAQAGQEAGNATLEKDGTPSSIAYKMCEQELDFKEFVSAYTNKDGAFDGLMNYLANTNYFFYEEVIEVFEGVDVCVTKLPIREIIPELEKTEKNRPIGWKAQGSYGKDLLVINEEHFLGMSDINFMNTILVEESLHKNYDDKYGKHMIVNHIYNGFTTGEPKAEFIRSKMIKYSIPKKLPNTETMVDLCRLNNNEEICDNVKRTYVQYNYEDNKSWHSLFHQWRSLLIKKIGDITDRSVEGDISYLEDVLRLSIEVNLHLSASYNTPKLSDVYTKEYRSFSKLALIAKDLELTNADLSSHYLRLYKNLVKAPEEKIKLRFAYYGESFHSSIFERYKNKGLIGFQAPFFVTPENRKGPIEFFVENFNEIKKSHSLVYPVEYEKFSFIVGDTVDYVFDSNSSILHFVKMDREKNLKNLVNNNPSFFKERKNEYSSSQVKSKYFPKNRKDLVKNKNKYRNVVKFYSYLIESNLISKDFKLSEELSLSDVLRYYSETKSAGNRLRAR